MEEIPVLTAGAEPTAELRGVALFDLDRTLVPGSSLVPFGRELVRRGMIDRMVVARRAAAAATFRRRGLDRRIDALVGGMLTLVAGHAAEPLAEVGREVGRQLAGEVYDAAHWLLRRHLDAGDFCVILTAAPQPLAEGLADVVGAHRAIGTSLKVIDGRFTGELDGGLCHGPGKLIRLRQELGDLGSTHATGYGDSSSDIAVLERCQEPVAVNPDRRLTAVARLRGWPVVRLS